MSFFAQHAQFFIQFAVVLLCILAGAQVGGIGLGVFGGIGLAILSFDFGVCASGWHWQRRVWWLVDGDSDLWFWLAAD